MDCLPPHILRRTGDYNYSRDDYAGDRYNRDHGKPITSRVGAGRRARIAVETGGPYATALEESRKYQAERRQRELAEKRERAKMDARRKHEAYRRPHPMASPERSRPQTRRHSPRRPSPRRNSHEIIINPDDGEILEPMAPAGSYEGSAHSPRSSTPSARVYSQVYDDSEDYDFKLPLKVQAATYDYVEEVSFPLDTNSTGDSGKPSQAQRSKFSGPVTELDISQSRWVGSACDRGDLSADITVPTADGTQIEKRQDPLMKWYHLERSTMSLEEFIAASQSVLQVSEQKRRDINRLMRDVQRKYEKQRQHGRDLEPDCMSDMFVGDSTKQSACVMFLAFPYFCLEPYDATQFKNLTPGTPMHPLRPLLQAHFHSTSQRRELAQAITKFPNTGDGNCLQLSQIWCLIVDGDTMITCSRQSHDTLCSPAITKSDVSSTEETPKIKVSFGNDRSWLIPVNDDTTWPGFLSLFGESIASLETDGAAADFKVNGESVDAGQWSFLVGAAQTGSVGLDLHQAMLQSSGQSQMVSTIPDPNVAEAGPPPADSTASEGANILYSGAVDTPAVEGDEDCLRIFKYTSNATLESLADSLDDVLRRNVREKERAAYDRVDAMKASAMNQWTRTNSGSSQNYRTTLVGPALYLFRFFWPPRFDNPLADKYWGAIGRILQQDARTYRAANVESVLADLVDNAIPLMQSLTREFSASKEDLEPLPDAYSKAFLHLIMVFVLLSQTSERRTFGVNGSTVRAHVKGLKEELSIGKREITTRLKAQAAELEDLEICTDTSLLALIINQFSQDVMHGKPDVATTYNDYFYQLDFRITEDPRPRSHQETLRFFMQEVEAILSTLQYQLSVLEAFEQSLRQQQQPQSSEGGSSSGDDNFLLQYALGESRQQIVLDDCKARISSRIDKFRGLQQRAQDLGEWHRNEMETNKDRQENAIMVFTIVTIIFLPLSFVSSVFGMNTTDVRDMPYSQWAYWAAGVPLTVLVVVGSLWWAGEFEGFGSWLQRAMSRASSAGGYLKIPEPVTYGGRRMERGEIDVYRGEVPPLARQRTTYPRRR